MLCVRLHNIKIISLQPKVVTDTDEAELTKELERLEQLNLEVDGDDSPDEGDDESADEEEADEAPEAAS